mgnify:CR=1 FL=1
MKQTMRRKPIQVIVLEPEKTEMTEKVEIIEGALNPENYLGFPRNHTYSVVGIQTTKQIPKEFDVIIIQDSMGVDSLLNKLAQTKWAPRTICVGKYERKDHIEIGGFYWIYCFFFLTTALPELINKIVDKP